MKSRVDFYRVPGDMPAPLREVGYCRGEIYLCANVFPDPKAIVVAAAAENVMGAHHKNHVYLPASWLMIHLVSHASTVREIATEMKSRIEKLKGEKDGRG